jgi:monooxygenase
VRKAHAQVVIIGGGPVGLLLAAELAERGVGTLLLEERTEISAQPKATTLHARTVQCLVRRGHIDLPVTTGTTAVTRPFHFGGIPGLSVSAPAAEPEPLLKRPQVELERRFEQRARETGARILRGHRVTEVQEVSHGVHITAYGPEGRVSCSADYVVGADGARSMVREQAGIASTTHPATVSAMFGNVRLLRADDLRPGWHNTPRGWLTVGQEQQDGTVHIRTLNCAGACEDRHRPLGLEELVQEVSWIMGRDIAMDSPSWLGRFSDFSRLACSYRAGRIFLAGDAAHVHFPIGGQGLSTGLLDAVNLGWKLALAVRGRAGAELLDSYDQERRPAAQRVIDNTRAQLALMRPLPELDPLRAFFAELLPRSGESGLLAAMVSAQDTVLPALTENPSPWEGTFLHNVALSTRQGETDVVTLLRDGRPLLLLLGEDTEAHEERARGWDDMLRVVHAAPVSTLACDALLVRPDGYVAWAAGAGGLEAALSVYFGERAGPAARGRHAEAVR